MHANGVLARINWVVETLVVAALLLRASPAVGQAPVCEAPESSNEAKLLAFFATPISFSVGGLVQPLEPGQYRVALEASYVPSPSRSIQQPEACYGIKKTENTNLSPVFPRPRIAVGLPGGFVLEGSYLPPIKVADAEPNLGSVALSLPIRLHGTYEKGPLSLLLRGHATFGRVRGPITCPKDKLQQTDPAAACFGPLQSIDTYKPNMYGGELAIAKSGAAERWGAYASGGVTLLRPRFQVGFLYANGAFDNTKITVDMTRLAVGAGGWFRVGRTTAVTGELYSVPEDATTFRLGAVLGFR
jgi:hypothetical protein